MTMTWLKFVIVGYIVLLVVFVISFIFALIEVNK